MPVKRYVVTGTVQGVGFRYFTFTVATRLGLNGFVRNLPDGSVEVEAEGDPSRLSDLCRALARGPAGSRVADVVETDSEGGGFYRSFQIRG